MNPKTIPAYLRGHAEPLPSDCPAPLHAGHVLVVPMRAEGRNFLPLLKSLEKTQRQDGVLLITVVNGPDDSNESIHDSNEESLSLLEDTFHISQGRSCCYRIGQSKRDQLLLIDLASEPWRMSPNQGVGLARKTGCDLALRLVHEGIISSRWIHSTDADVQLPEDYFCAPDPFSSDSEVAGLAYPFLHEVEGPPDLHRAIRLYEVSLYYYELGLRWAGSPYAYQNIGSTLAVKAWNYAAVRGFPRKQAGEDFYLLNKVAKTGKIVRPSSQPIRIRGRRSFRVPFGTGAAMNKMVEAGNGISDFKLYHPSVFEALRAVLKSLALFAKHGDLSQFHDQLSFPRTHPLAAIEPVVEAMGFPGALEEAKRQSPDSEALLNRLHAWFDSFRCLRFIHQIRDETLPSIPWKRAMNEAPFLDLDREPRDDFESLCLIRTSLEESCGTNSERSDSMATN